ncbi:hypothetical protein BC834DRAFT_893539 [Gloeopeniophorella convolvens]|nr:hypothetical protein BC834DRAFT_893539 [Gloeopeniophorella convolvens]
MTEIDCIPEHESRGSGHNASAENYVDKAAIHSLPDIALLEIFNVLRKIQSSDLPPGRRSPWHRLVPAHICSRWRKIILASPKYLRLTIYCGNSIHVAQILQYSPPFPLDIEYRLRGASEWTPEILDNALLALRHHKRIAHIRLFAPPDVIEQLLSAVEGETPQLETLQIQSVGTTQTALPKAFFIGDTSQLRRLHLRGVALPLPQHFPSVTSFHFTMIISNTPQASWMEQVLNALRAMPRIQDLTLDFNRHRFSSSSQSARTTLPRLSSLTLFGLTDHIEELMGHFDAPSLSKFAINILDSFISPMPSLPRFVNQSAALKSPLAFVGLANECISIKIGGAPTSHGSFVLRAHEVERHGVVDSVAQISTALASAFAEVETLVLGLDDDDYISDREDLAAPDPENWHVLLPAMNAVTTLRVDGESSVSLAEALCQPSPVKLLPRLRSVRLYFHVSDGAKFNPCDVLTRYQPFIEESWDGQNVVDVSCEVLNNDNFDCRHYDLKC